MQFKSFVRVGTIITSFMLVFVIFITLSVFAMDPTQVLLFTNAILIVSVLVQLLMVNALVSIHDQVENRPRGRKK